MNSILHVPHSSALVPDEERSSILLSNTQLDVELLRMTDWFTDELFTSASERFPVVRFPVSRLVVDPERFVDDEKEIMASRGMGVIYTATSHCEPLRLAPDSVHRTRLINQYYVPHHQNLSSQVGKALESHKKALVIDCHSFPSRPLPYESDQDPNRPDICLGTDQYHTPPDLVGHTKEVFEHHHFSVQINRPFAGALVPAEYYMNNNNVSALMIEVNRGLYMDEETGEKSGGFKKIQDILHWVIKEVARFHGNI